MSFVPLRIELESRIYMHAWLMKIWILYEIEYVGFETSGENSNDFWNRTLILNNWLHMGYVLIVCNVFICSCVQKLEFEPLNNGYEPQEQFWKFQKLACLLERGKRRSSVECWFLELLQKMVSTRAGRFTLECQAM